MESEIEKQLPREIAIFLRTAGEKAVENGYKLYLVGGTVRDLLLKRPSLDLDLALEGNNDSAELLNIIGDVAGTTAILIDDEIDTAGSLVTAVSALTKSGASAVYSLCTHPVFSGPAIERISKSAVKEVVVTDTIPVPTQKRNGKITVISTANLLGEAIRRIHAGESIGAMFQD